MRKKAFTLVEILVAMALGMILVGVLAFVFIQSGRIYTETLDEIDATYIVRSSMELIARDLRAIQMPAFPAEPGFPQDTSLDLKIRRVDVASGPQDELTYATIQHLAAAGQPEVPVVVEIRLDPATKLLTRTVTKRWDPVAGDWEAGFTPVVGNLAESVEGFAVSYSWPDAAGADVFHRGDPAGYANSASNGSLFFYRGSANIWGGVMAVTAAPPEWDANLPVPGRAARTVHVNDLGGNASGAFPILEVMDKKTLRLGQAVNGTAVRFMLPMHPPSVKIALTHRTARGTKRSLERVLSLKR